MEPSGWAALVCALGWLFASLLGDDAPAYDRRLPPELAEAVVAAFDDAALDVGAPADGVRDAIREDYAERVGVDPRQVMFLSFEPVTWADACLGVHRPGQVCAQVVVPGFRAEVALRGGAEPALYHGSGDQFIAASFAEGAYLSEGDRPAMPEGLP